MTNRDIQVNYEALISLKNRNELRFPAKTAYAVTRNLRLLSPIYQDIMNTRQAFIAKHADPSPDNPGMWNIKEGHIEELDKELTNLDKTDNKIILYTITFDDISNLDISIEDMDALYFMISEG